MSAFSRKMLIISWIFVGIGILLNCACAQKIDTEADIEAIRSLNEKWDAAFNAGDPDGLASLYADDAIRMPPNMPAVAGKDAIRDMFKSFFEQCTTIDLKSTTEEIIVSGDWAFDRGPYTVTFTSKASGEQMRDSGKGMDFFKRQPDGSWKTYREIWNNDLPPSGAKQ